MKTDVLFGGGKQLGDFQLGEPHAAFVGTELHTGESVIGLIKNQTRAHAVTSLSISIISFSKSLISPSIVSSGRGGS